MRTRAGKRGWAAVLSLLVASGAGACGGAADHVGDDSLQAELRLSPTPPMAGTAGIGVRAMDDGVLVAPPGQVTVKVRGTAAPPEPLEYEGGSWVGSLEFPAPGEVRVEVGITAADGRTATLGLPVLVVRRP